MYQYPRLPVYLSPLGHHWATRHIVTPKRIQEWLEGGAKSPKEAVMKGEVEGAAVSDIADGRGQPGMALKLALVVVWLAFLQECGNELTDDLR